MRSPCLVKPGGMLGREMESDAVTGMAQERLARRHRLEDAGFPLLAEVVVDAAEVSHETGHPLGHVGVEIVADHLPWRRRGRGEHRLQERHEIRFGASIADGAADFARGDIEGGDQGFGAMAIYSNSRRSLCPGFIGRLGAARSSTWIPVISSIETV